jgi:hypothetical protein
VTGIGLPDMVVELETLSGEAPIDPDMAIVDLPIDSLVLVEWVYAIEERTGLPMLEVCLSCDNLEEMSLRALHAVLSDWAEAAAS